MNKLIFVSKKAAIFLALFGFIVGALGCSNKLEAENERLRTMVSELKQKSRQLDRQIRQQERKKREAQIALASANAKLQALDAQINERAADVLQPESDAVIGDAEFAAFELVDGAVDNKFINLHYWRADRDYNSWGIYAAGPAAFERARWSDPIRFRELTDYGAQARVRLRSDSKQNEIEILVHGEDGAFDLIQSLPRLEDGSPKLTKLDTSSVKDFYLVSGLPDVFVSKQDALSAIKKLKKQK